MFHHNHNHNHNHIDIYLTVIKKEQGIAHEPYDKAYARTL